MGRMVGTLMLNFQESHRTIWMFSACEASTTCIDGALYAIIGAAAVGESLSHKQL